ncbi:hypothetical protein [Alicyclobacillus sp. ALC3]|uniref:hypothetical protein n=1 Tax=Alicyclobacillus sp. ALC3 TaxID=2796143 RepID=UPI002379E97D|nr:hypothetical protein [Alicyclobacillus sp. ALC3]WDL96549.1 hypothetical protein JC200_19895 [Alicyclobacillus sp. ALC3]
MRSRLLSWYEASMCWHGNAIDTDGPHHGAAMLGSFEVIIFFCSLVATFVGGSAFVDIASLVAVAGNEWH